MTMHLDSFSVLFWLLWSSSVGRFVMVLISWTFCYGPDEFVSVFMQIRTSFDNNLPLTSACYHSEIENTRMLPCLCQCLTHLDVCNGILFNQERQTCKLIDCNPENAFTGRDFDTGRWDLYWRTTGMCKPRWLNHEGHCYFFNQTGAIWTNAKRMCEDNGGSLASIRSSEENSWSGDTFLPPWDSVACSQWWHCCEYWIGGKDLYVEGIFTWTSDNSTVGYVNWYPPYEPDNNGNQDCVSVCRDEYWADEDCDSVLSYICQAPTM